MNLTVPTLLASLACVIAFAQPAAADHGTRAVYQFDDDWSGCRTTFTGTFDSGSGSWQTWNFVVVAEGIDGGFCWTTADASVCSASGSIEYGFYGSCLNGGFYLDGTYHWHSCCGTTELDVHDGIYMEYYGGTLFWAYYQGYGGVVVSG